MNKVYIILIFLCTNLFLFAQVDSTKSLLWEITGNNLTKPSYLYGTMHVSEKIAFRLDDVFFEALENADKIALESDPALWLGDKNQEIKNRIMIQRYGNYSENKGFYQKNFRTEELNKKVISNYLSYDHQMVNGILYRGSDNRQNFQEDTYLDMFIYQAGKKNNKKIISLEDLSKSRKLVEKASKDPTKEKPDIWLQEKLKKEDYYSLIQEAYRERDIYFMDSLDKAMHTDSYIENMLALRNKNMVNKMDSVMHTASIFSGIGAAHLGGEEGVIQLLRDKGYTVNSLSSERTSIAEKKQKELEEKKIEVNYTLQTIDDGFLSLKAPMEIYNLGTYNNFTTYLSPDLANGASVSIYRLKTFSQLKNEEKVDLDYIEALLFENIPGEIKSKTKINTNGIEGIEVKNELKTGDLQSYRIYVTPIEVLILKLKGKQKHVDTFADEIFGSLTFNISNSNLKTIEDETKKFSVKLPSLLSYSQKQYRSPKIIDAYDAETNSYYLLNNSSLSDLKYIEIDTFEIKQIQKRFYQSLEIDTLITYNSFEKTGNRYSLKSNANFLNAEGNIHLYTTTAGDDYYFLVCITSDEQIAKSYFNSFKLGKIEYTDKFEVVKDTIGYFNVFTNVEQPAENINRYNNYLDSDEDKKDYEAFSKNRTYISIYGEKIDVETYKYHDLTFFENYDSIWTYLKEGLEKKYNFKYDLVKFESDNYGKYPSCEMILGRKGSTKQIREKYIINNSLFYTVSTTQDSELENSKFVTSFFDSFTPTDTIIGRSLIKPKNHTLLTALIANDSIAFGNEKFLYINELSADTIKYFIEDFEYSDETKAYKNEFIYALNKKLNNKEAFKYFSNLYLSEYGNGDLQLDILSSISDKRTKESAMLFSKLINKDLPLTESSKSIEALFYPYADSLELVQYLFPDLLVYRNIKEYQISIKNVLVEAIKESKIKKSKYKQYKNEFIKGAQIDFKRAVAKTKTYNENRNSNRYYYNNNSFKAYELINNLYLLDAFKKRKEVREYATRLRELDNDDLKNKLLYYDIKNNNPLDTAYINKAYEDINLRKDTYTLLAFNNALDNLGELDSVQWKLAEADLLGYNKEFDPKKDTILPLTYQTIVVDGDSLYTYFFKTKFKSKYSYSNEDNFTLNAVTFKYIVATEKEKQGNKKNLAPKTLYRFYEYSGDDYTGFVRVKSQDKVIKDTDNVEEMMEEFLEELRIDKYPRAMVYKKNSSNGYNRW